MLHHLLLPPWKGCGAHCGLGGQWEPWGSRGKGGAQQVSSAAHCDEGGPSGLQAGRRASRQQEGLEGLSRELQARHSDVSIRAGYGAGDPECCDMAHASNGGIRSSWHGILKARCLLTTLISYDKVTHLVEEGEALVIVCLAFYKAFDTAAHSILPERLAAQGLGRHTVCWLKKWLDGWAQGVLASGVQSRFNPVGVWTPVAFSRALYQLRQAGPSPVTCH